MAAIATSGAAGGKLYVRGRSGRLGQFFDADDVDHVDDRLIVEVKRPWDWVESHGDVTVRHHDLAGVVDVEHGAVSLHDAEWSKYAVLKQVAEVAGCNPKSGPTPRWCGIAG